MRLLDRAVILAVHLGPDRLVAHHVGVDRVDHHRDAAQLRSGRQFPGGGVAADEIVLLHLDEAVHAALERPVDRAELAEPGREILLEPHRQQRAHAEIDDAQLGAGILDRVIDQPLIGRLHPDLIAEIAGVGDAVDHAWRAADRHVAEIHEAEGLRRDVLVDQLGEQRLAFRPSDRQADQRLVEAVDAHRTVLRQMLFEPAHVIFLGGRRTPDHEFFVASFCNREIADQPAELVEHRGQHDAPLLRHAVGHQPVEEVFRTSARHFVLGEVGDLGDADALAHRAYLVADMLEIIGAVERDDILGLGAVGREPQRRLQPPGIAHHSVLRDHRVVERRGLRGSRGWQFLVGEADREAARIVLPHLGVGVAQRGPFAPAGDIHAPHVEARIAVDHPVGQRQPDAAALAEAGHDAAGDPEIGEALHRANQRVAVRREGEGAVDDLLDAGLLDAGEMPEADLQRRRDAVEVWRQQLVAEIPRRVDRRPRLAGLLISAEQDAVALLAGVDLTLEVEHADHLAPGRLVEGLDLRHRLRQKVHVLHGQHRQFDADHAADLARPQATAIHHMLGLHRSLFGDHVPGAVRILGQFLDRVAEHDLGAELFGRLRIGDGGARRVEMAFDRVPHGADEMPLVHQREHRLGFRRRDQLGVHAEITALGVGKPQEVHALGAVGEHDAAGQMQRAGLAGNLLQLLVELDGVGLQLGDVGIAVQRVEATGRMPGRAGGQLRALDQHDIGPAGAGEVEQHRAADDAAADDNCFDVGFHEVGSVVGKAGSRR